MSFGPHSYKGDRSLCYSESDGTGYFSLLVFVPPVALSRLDGLVGLSGEADGRRSSFSFVVSGGTENVTSQETHVEGGLGECGLRVWEGTHPSVESITSFVLK